MMNFHMMFLMVHSFGDCGGDVSDKIGMHALTGCLIAINCGGDVSDKISMHALTEYPIAIVVVMCLIILACMLLQGAG